MSWSRPSNAAIVCIWLAAGCGSQLQTLPRAREPFTPSPNAPFRKAPPALLEGLAPWVPPVASVRELGNGMRVIVVERHERPIVSVRYVNRWATLHGVDQGPGLSVLVGDALLEGTVVSQNEVVVDQRIAGVRPRVFTADDGTTVQLDVLSSAPAVQTLAQIVRQPELGPEGAQAAGRLQHDALFEQSHRLVGVSHAIEMRVLYGGDHPLATDPRSVQKELGRLSLAEVRDYYRRIYVPNASALVVVGDVNADEVFALAERSFGSWKRGGEPPTPLAFEPRTQREEVHAIYTGSPLVALTILQPGVGLAHPQYPAFALMSRIVAGGLTSGVNRILRHDLGATYGASFRLESFGQHGFVRFQVAVEPAMMVKAVDTLRKQLERLRSEYIGYSELNAAKRAYLSSLQLASTAWLADMLATLDKQGLTPAWLVGIEAAVQRVGVEEIRELASTLLDPENSSVVAAGDFGPYPELRSLGGKVSAYTIESR